MNDSDKTKETAQDAKGAPSKTSGGSNLSGLRDFVIGISGLTWRNVEREVR